MLLFSLSYVTNQALLPKQVPLERRNVWAYARITVLVLWQNQVSDMCHMQHMPFPGRWLSERFCSARMGVAVWGFLSILLCSWCDRFKIFLVMGRKQPGLTFKQICAETSVWVQVPLWHLSIPEWLKLSLMGLQSWFPHFAVFGAQGAWTSLLSAAGRCSSLCSSFWALNLRLDRLLGALCRL